MFTASFFILALHALVGQFIHSVYRERCGDGPRDIEARGGARGGEARCGPRDSGARGGIRGGGAQGFQDGEACFGNKCSGGDALGVPRGSTSFSF